MIRRKKKVGIIRTKKRIIRTKKTPQKISRIKNRNVKCWAIHYGGDYNRFYVKADSDKLYYKTISYYLTYDEAIKLKIYLEKLYTAKFEIKNYGNN